MPACQADQQLLCYCLSATALVLLLLLQQLLNLLGKPKMKRLCWDALVPIKKQRIDREGQRPDHGQKLLGSAKQGTNCRTLRQSLISIRDKSMQRD